MLVEGPGTGDIMLGTLFRLALLVIVLFVVGALLLGYRWGSGSGGGDPVVGTTGERTAPAIDSSRAREAGAEVAETIAEGANRAQAAVAAASLTSKIKAKMTLDDTLDAGRIDVDTEGTTVRLSGSVDTEAQRLRAVQLARETDGVSQVVDRLQVRGPR
jgi:osmotically-inducible protein OsmY